MNNKIESQILSNAPHLEADHVREFCEGLNPLFFKTFDPTFVTFCCEKLSQINRDSPFYLYTSFQKDSGDITIMTYDYAFCFSVFVGLISSLGFNVMSGSFFSYETKDKLSPDDPVYKKLKKILGARRNRNFQNLKRKKIIYTFSGQMVAEGSKEIFQRSLQKRLETVISLLETKTETQTLKARELVHGWVSNKIRKLKKNKPLSPHESTIKFSNNKPDVTVITITTFDTPFFLYALTLSFNFLNIDIVTIDIKTKAKYVEDRIAIQTKDGKKITEKSEINRIKLIIILLKQFTYFSDNSSNPFKSIHRFVDLIQNALDKSNQDDWVSLLSSDKNMKNLAKILGASDFLWEEFIRIDADALLPVLKPRAKRSEDVFLPTLLEEELKGQLTTAQTFEEEVAIINAFKDTWTTTIDLYHILNELTFATYSKYLTSLADIVLSTMCSRINEKLRQAYGTPLTNSGYESAYALCGLGKLGGQALGYASDIEFLFIYGDEGETNGKKSIKASEFYGKFVDLIKTSIHAKRDGIFSIDLRLRPYGKNGPKAVSVASLCSYFSPEGDAYLYERLALVRLRYICGDSMLGNKVQGLRSEFVYNTHQQSFQQIHDLRQKQLQSMASFDGEGKALFNAKFSPGGLVDIEYSVQALQMKHGFQNESLQTPSIHQALESLSNLDILPNIFGEKLLDAYSFYRKLINGLRMLRGNAKDLTVPAFDTHDCLYLAKRIGFGNENIHPTLQLKIELDSHASVVRHFVEKYLHADYFSSKGKTVADILVNKTMAENEKTDIISSYGLKSPERALENLEHIQQTNVSSPHLMQVIIYAFNKLKDTPDPDRALNNWERYLENTTSSEKALASLSSEFRLLDMIFDIFSCSQFLSDALIKQPQIFDDIFSSTNTGYVLEHLKRGQIFQKIEKIHKKDWLNDIRILRRVEMIKIAIKDICFQKSIEAVTRDLSYLAEGFIQSALKYAWQIISKKHPSIPSGKFDLLENNVCILAFGKLGGTELNYSSDIDIVGVYHQAEDHSNEIEQLYVDLLTELHGLLTKHTTEGFTYRIDYNLRPYGKRGKLIASTQEFEAYYQEDARQWELQALLKARPVAGNWWIGFEVLRHIKLNQYKNLDANTIISSIRSNREAQLNVIKQKHIQKIDIKNGPNGIRAIEFLVQGLQLIHIEKNPQLFCSKTLISLRLLRDHHILPHAHYDVLKNAYILFRRVEHFLQILEDRQTHHLPESEGELKILAKKTLGKGATTQSLLNNIQNYQEKIAELKQLYFERTNS